MASAAGPVGGSRGKGEIADVEMEILEPPGEAAVGLKRARNAEIGNGSYGFTGVTTAEKKPTLQPHNSVKFLKKAINGSLRQDIDATFKSGGLYLHDTHGSQTLADSNALSSSPVGDPKSKTRPPTRICTFYAQGHCKKGKNCNFRHEREGHGYGNLLSEEEKAGSLGSVGIGKHRGSEEGSEAQGLSNLKDLQFENFAASSKHGLYRTLIHSYGEEHRGVAHNSTTFKVSEERSCRTDDLWTTKPTPPVNELLQIPVVQEKNQQPYFMERHASLPSDGYLDGKGLKGTLPKLHLDGGKLLSDVAKPSSLSDSHVSGTYLEVHPLHPDYQSRPFDYLQYSERLSAYGGPTENLLHKHQKPSSSLATYSSNSITGFRNPVHNQFTLGSQPFRATAHLGMPSLHPLSPGIEKVGLHKDVRFDKGCGTSRPALLASSSHQPGHLSPIKDKPWITSVPFVPLVSFPGSTSPSYSQYDQLVDSMDLREVKGNILKSSNISCSTSSQHTTGNVVIDGHTNKSLNYDDKLARNMSAKGSNEFAGLVAPDRERSSLDGDTMVKVSERKNDAAINEKTRDFRFHLAEHVKELLKPYWKEGNLNKDAHKLIVKKSVDKVLSSVELHQVPATKEMITDYITMAGTKIEKLVKAYVDKHRMR